MTIKYNYTKSTKLHILQMAVRKKFKDEFNSKMELAKEAMTVKAELMGDHKELSKLPEHLHKNFESCSAIYYHGNRLITVNQGVSLESREYIRNIELKRKVFVKHTLVASLKDGDEIKGINLFLKEVDQFAMDVETALNTYSTYKKAVNALPWIEEFHPDFDKKPVCNLVPIDTINKVNKLMGF